MKSKLPEKLSAILPLHKRENQQIISDAFLFAEQSHGDQKRKSGEPYVNHPMRVAINLANNHFDLTTVLAGLLHDVIEDTVVEIETIKEQFGPEVASIVEGVTKVSSYKIRDKSKIFSDSALFLDRVDNYRKILFAATADARVLAVKLYDRLDNLETISWIPVEKRKFYARESIEIFAPIAERLGMGALKRDLEDQAFPYAFPKEYKHFMSQLGDTYKNAESFVDSIIPDVQTKIETAGIKIFSISGRAKSHYSLYKKIQRKGSLSTIHDVLALRIIVNSIEDCYKTLGIIHSLFEPLPSKIKDYISRPKQNGYQSIHTTLCDKSGNKFEVQIRTNIMHEAAENGLIAHWNYEEAGTSGQQKVSALEWVKELSKLKFISSKKEFLTELRDNFFAHQIFVFTPKGDIIRLPIGSTPLDFAYMIHTGLGHRTVGAKINGHIVTLPTLLSTGDTVEIIAGKVMNPKEDWLKIVKTSQARHKIRALTKIKHESALVELGKKKVISEIERNSLPPLNKTEAEKLLSDSTIPYQLIDKAYVAIGEGNLGVIRFLKCIYPTFKTTEVHHRTLTGNDALTIPALKNIPYELANCCKPKKNDQVVGYLGRKPIIMIHRANCKRLTNIEKRRLISLA